ncbi:MAG: hypothetical protein JWP74_1708 [Marmoricola sp.]|nr:hypothetical protein [Marmoricola sp.]
MSPRETKRRQYASGSLYQRADGRWFGAYEVGFKKNGKRDRRTVSAATRVEAKQKLEARLRELDRTGTSKDQRKTVKAWVDEWLPIAEKKNRPNTHTADIAATKWIVETIGHRPLSELEPADVRAVHNAIEKTRSSSTAARYHGTLIRLLKAASVEGHRIPPNVFLVEKPEEAVNDRQDIPLADCLALLQVIATLPHGSRWLFALLQGPRQGETLGLTWDELVRDPAGDLDVTYAWQLQPLPYRELRNPASGFRVPRGYEARQLAGQMHLVRPKSKAGWRNAPVVDVVAKALEAWKTVAPPSPHGLVWPALDGSPADENEDRQEWHAIQGTAMVGHPSGRYYTVHEVRHGTATMLKALGVPESTRVAIMGHSSKASTRIYEHTEVAEMRKALNRVATVLQLG